MDHGLAAAEAAEGFVAHPGGNDGKAEFQAEVFDMLGNIQNLSKATNEALTTHIGELAAVEELTTKNGARAKALSARTKRVAA